MRDTWGPPTGKKMLVFIDDINMPKLDKYLSQPPIELLRQVIDQGGFFELKKIMFMKIKDCQFISACAPPGGGRKPVTDRLMRHFNIIWLPELTSRSMNTIFHDILKGHLQNRKNKKKGLDSIEQSAQPIVKSSVMTYLKIRADLKPSPSKSHYTFNLRDLSKIVQGILQVDR